jgi:hypothetical protein
MDDDDDDNNNKNHNNKNKLYLQEVGWWSWTGLIWLRIATGGRLL